MNNAIILASKSPRRIELLEKAGFVVTSIPANTEENINPQWGPEETVINLSMEKAQAVRNVLKQIIGDSNNDYVNFPSNYSALTAVLSEDLPIIAADTIVYLDNIIGKPRDKDDALSILMKLSGKEHKVYTGVIILSLLDGSRKISFVDETSVFFKEYSPHDIEDYLNTDEPYDKAGAYAIQGYFGRFIDHIEGDYSNVMGLPIPRLLEELKNF